MEQDLHTAIKDEHSLIGRIANKLSTTDYGVCLQAYGGNVRKAVTAYSLWLEDDYISNQVRNFCLHKLAEDDLKLFA